MPTPLFALSPALDVDRLLGHLDASAARRREHPAPRQLLDRGAPRPEARAPRGSAETRAEARPFGSRMPDRVDWPQPDRPARLALDAGRLGWVPMGITRYLDRPFVYPIGNGIGELIADGREWDALLRAVASTVLPGDEPFICEVGANIGASLLQLLNVKPRARVVAFEPSDRFRPFLLQNLHLADARHVEVVPLLAGRRIGSMKLHNTGTTASVVTTGYDPEMPPGVQLVEMTTLDRVIHDRGPVDLIRIDADGYDLEVLRGAESILRRDRPTLLFEFTPHLISDPTGDLGWLRDLGYRRSVCFTAQGALIGVTEDPAEVVSWATNPHMYCDVLVCPVESWAEARLEGALGESVRRATPRANSPT